MKPFIAKALHFTLAAALLVAATVSTAKAEEKLSVAPAATAYEYSFQGVDGKPFALKDYKGKVMLVVNTATGCGFAGQFAGLQKLYETYKDKGLVVIGVPENDFGGQEPLTGAQVIAHIKETYHADFPVTEKTVVSGDDAHPFYKWAVEQNVGGFLDSRPRWNFHKYLVSRDGRLVGSFGSSTAPDDEKLVAAIEGALAQKPE
ncbi:MAG: glutathione peroxidase [Micavibrio sp.]|nr:glutathione peroxidase [Micavibrio sp.]